MVGGGDGGSLFGAFSGAGTGADGGGNGGFLLGAFSRAGIGLVCTGDGGFLFGAFSWALGRAPKFWKYKLQVVDNSMRCESRHFKTSLSLRAPAQSLCTSGPHDARRALPIVGGELPTVTGAAVCVAGLCALGLEALARLSTGSGFKSVAEPFRLDFNELEPAAGAAAARPAELFFARRTQALSSAHARFVSGEYSRRPETAHDTNPSRAINAPHVL